MVNASKILTVSYGTFSCTLEGFDDPFSTMRSIAEYFRDLAADDRYFGAEPPTPDAEMLHRIAEREIQRRVEARVQGNGVVLRQMDEGQEASPALSPPEADAARDTTVAPAPPVVKSAPTVTKAATPVDTPEEGSVEAKLARIRAAMARGSTPFEGADLAPGAFENGAPVESDITPAADLPEPAPEPEPEPEAQDHAAQPVAAEDSIASPATAEEDKAAALAEDPEDTSVAEDAAAKTEEAALSEETVELAPAEDTVEIEAPEIGNVISEAADPADAEDTGTPEDAIAAALDSDSEEEVIEAKHAQAEDIAAELSEDATETADAAAEIGEDEAEAEPADLDDAALIAALAEDQDETAATTEEAPQSEAKAVVTEAPDAEDLAPVSDDTEAVEDAEADALLAKITDSAGADEAEADTPYDTEDSAEKAPEIEEDALAGFTEDILAAAEDDPKDLGADPGIAEPVEAAEETADESPEALKDTLAALVAETQVARDDTGTETEIEDTALDLGELDVSDDITPDTSGKLMLSDAQRVKDDEASETAPPEEAERPRVRVVKMSRAEFDKNFVAEDEDEDTPDLTSEDEIRKALGDTGLSAEDEADLISELAEAERETDLPLEPPAAKAEPVAAQAPAADIEPTPEAKRPAEDLSVDRLLAQTDTELADTESSRRRSAIAHLKAAVAAVRADGSDIEAKAKSADETLGQFRDDLAEAVRTTPAAVPEAPATPEPKVEPKHATNDHSVARRPRPMPPLMLVSEQRVDKPAEDASAGPIRPRRVHATDIDDEPGNVLLDDSTSPDAQDAEDNVFSESNDFRGFVEDAGAEDLQELLEASAAFGTFVEDQGNNSRPQIMARVQRYLPEGSFSREDGLRAFGVLLREGRIVRVERGRFAAPDKSPFKPEQRSATG